MTGLNDFLAVARDAARVASRLCLAVLDEAPERPDAMAKLGREPVTVADYGSQAVILEAVSAAFPQHRVISEEGAEHFRDHAGRAGSEQVVRLVGEALGRPVGLDEVLGWIDHTGGDADPTWAVDPIDGTRAFIRGLPTWSILVGIERDGKPVVGVALMPAAGDLFVGVRGIGSHANGRPVRLSTVATLAHATVMWMANGRNPRAAGTFKEAPGEARGPQSLIGITTARLSSSSVGRSMTGELGSWRLS